MQKLEPWESGQRDFIHVNDWCIQSGAIVEKLCSPQGFSQDPEVAVAILELFHLLPYKASMYLETVQVFT